MISAFCLTLRSTQQQQTAAFKMEQLEIESVPKIPAIISKILYYITLSSSKIIVLNVWHDNSDEIWLWCCLSIPDNWVGVGECLAWAGPGSNLDTQLALLPLGLAPMWWPELGIIRWLDLRGLTSCGLSWGDKIIIEAREDDLGKIPGKEELRLEREKLSRASSATMESKPLRIIHFTHKSLQWMEYSWKFSLPFIQLKISNTNSPISIVLNIPNFWWP